MVIRVLRRWLPLFDSNHLEVLKTFIGTLEQKTKLPEPIGWVPDSEALGTSRRQDYIRVKETSGDHRELSGAAG